MDTHDKETRMGCENDAKKLELLKRSRTGKKGVITKKINKIGRLVAEEGSRTLCTKLVASLRSVLVELSQVCCEISKISEAVDPLNCLEQIKDDVETCILETNEYLESRAGDPDSSGSFTSSWVQKHAQLVSEGSGSDLGVGERETDNVSLSEFATPQGLAEASPGRISAGGSDGSITTVETTVQKDLDRSKQVTITLPTGQQYNIDHPVLTTLTSGENIITGVVPQPDESTQTFVSENPQSNNGLALGKQVESGENVGKEIKMENQNDILIV